MYVCYIHRLENFFFFFFFKQQVTDINDSNGTIVTLENGQTYQIPQYQMYAPVLQRAQNGSINEEVIEKFFLLFYYLRHLNVLWLFKIIVVVL